MIQLEVAGGAAVTLLVRGMAKWGLDIRSHREPLRRSIKEVIAPAITKSFSANGLPEWEALDPTTIVRKTAGGFPVAYPLQRTGNLAKVAGQINSWTISTDGAVLDRLPNAEYGMLHMSGTKNMPARPFADIDDDNLYKIEQVFADWITERALKAGIF